MSDNADCETHHPPDVHTTAVSGCLLYLSLSWLRWKEGSCICGSSYVLLSADIPLSNSTVVFPRSGCCSCRHLGSSAAPHWEAFPREDSCSRRLRRRCRLILFLPTGGFMRLNSVLFFPCFPNPNMSALYHINLCLLQLVLAESTHSDGGSQCTESHPELPPPLERTGGIGDSRPPSFQ